MLMILNVLEVLALLLIAAAGAVCAYYLRMQANNDERFLRQQRTMPQMPLVPRRR